MYSFLRELSKSFGMEKYTIYLGGVGARRIEGGDARIFKLFHSNSINCHVFIDHAYCIVILSRLFHSKKRKKTVVYPAHQCNISANVTVASWQNIIFCSWDTLYSSGWKEEGSHSHKKLEKPKHTWSWLPPLFKQPRI